MQRILAVDDNEDILEILQLILEDSGYEVETLTDGHLLFDTIKAHRPDLILLDIGMPVMNGAAAFDKIKELYPKIKIIFLLALPTIFHIFSNYVPMEERSRSFSYLIALGSVGQTFAALV